MKVVSRARGLNLRKQAEWDCWGAVQAATKRRALSRCRIEDVTEAMSRCLIYRVTNAGRFIDRAAATASRQVCMADDLKARCVLAEVRWR